MEQQTIQREAQRLLYTREAGMIEHRWNTWRTSADDHKRGNRTTGGVKLQNKTGNWELREKQPKHKQNVHKSKKVSNKIQKLFSAELRVMTQSEASWLGQLLQLLIRWKNVLKGKGFEVAPLWKDLEQKSVLLWTRQRTLYGSTQHF